MTLPETFPVGDRPPLNPDPLFVPGEEDRIGSRRFREERMARMVLIGLAVIRTRTSVRRFWRRVAIAAFVAGLAGGILLDRVALAAPRSAPEQRAPAPTRSEASSRMVAPPSLRPVVSVLLTPGPSATRAAASPGGPTFGVASWYDADAGLYAALPGPWRSGRRALVCGPDRSCLSVPVVTSCGCPNGRLIDLSADAFRRMAPLSQGLVDVWLTVLDG